MSTNDQISAIDVGSNAVRMVIAETTDSGRLHIRHKFRFPIRLGADVFANGKISAKNMKAAARAFRRFKELADNHKIKKIQAVGTSALREATNSKQFIEFIKRMSGIKIKVIDGVEEARLIHLAVRHEVDLENRNVLLIDIGGGSVELTFSENGMMSATQSFPFGTVRTLDHLKKRKLTEAQMNLVLSEYIKPLSQFIHSHIGTGRTDFAVGTGGNLEALAKLRITLLKSNGRSELSYKELLEIMSRLQALTYTERVEKVGLRPDRADVIIPAGLVTLTILRQCAALRLIVPNVGLRDGLLLSMIK